MAEEPFADETNCMAARKKRRKEQVWITGGGVRRGVGGFGTDSGLCCGLCCVVSAWPLGYGNVLGEVRLDVMVRKNLFKIGSSAITSP